MEISFPDDQSQQLYERKARLEAAFGPQLASLICRRLSMFKAASSLGLVPAGRPVDLVHDGNGSCSVALGPSHRLAFQIVGDAGSGTKKLSDDAITEVQIVGVIDAEP